MLLFNRMVSLVMVANDVVPALPPNAVAETNRETLARLQHDLAWIDLQLQTATDEYRMYVYDGLEQPYWGYCVESARVDSSRDILVLMRSSGSRARASTLWWMPMSKV